MASTLTTARAGIGLAAAFLALCLAALFAWAILGEALSPIRAVGGVLILGGIWIARPKEAAPGEGRSPS
jgi:drug/metabolite transporter (DMT)-like permease